jgi:hypothetical protein
MGSLQRLGNFNRHVLLTETETILLQSQYPVVVYLMQERMYCIPSQAQRLPSAVGGR